MGEYLPGIMCAHYDPVQIHAFTAALHGAVRVCIESGAGQYQFFHLIGRMPDLVRKNMLLHILYAHNGFAPINAGTQDMRQVALTVSPEGAVSYSPVLEAIASLNSYIPR